mgnify:FL=1
MKKISIKDIVKYASVAAIYVVLTWILAPISFGPIQFRISEVLVLLCFFDKKYFIPLTLGCLISNLMSPMVLDIAFGTIATMISLFFISNSKNLFVASLFPVFFNGLIIAAEISIIEGIFDLNVFLFNMVTIAVGEFLCVSVIGVILFTLLRKNEGFINLIQK